MSIKRKQQRWFFIFGCCLFFIICLTGCSQKTEITVEGVVSLLGPNTDYQINIAVSGQEPTAEDAILAACQQEKLSYTLTDGLFDHFNGQASTATKGWLFYLNGQLSEVGAKEVKLEDGFTIVMRYEDYQEAFAQAGMES